MNHTSLLSLLHLSDPTLPIGAFSHSNGLETYINNKKVNSFDTAKAYISQTLHYNYAYNDGLFLREAFNFSKQEDLIALLKLDVEMNAFRAPREIREGSVKLGTRLLKIFKLTKDYKFLAEFIAAIEGSKTKGHYAIVYGMLGALMDLKLEDVLSSFYFNATVGMVTNCVKMVPLGQVDGQIIMNDMLTEIEHCVTKTLKLNSNMRGMCNCGSDIASMQHEHLYTRIYMS